MDTISQGAADRAPRRGVASGVAALLLLAGLGLTALRGDGPARPGARPTPAPVQPVASVEPIPAEADPYIPAPQPSEEFPEQQVLLPDDADLTGRFTTAPGDDLLLLGDNEVLSYDMRTSRATPVAGAQPGVDEFVLDSVRLGDAVALLVGVGIAEFPPTDVGRVYVVRGTRGTQIGEAAGIAPDGTGTGLWLTTWNEDRPTSTHVDLTGRRLAPPVRHAKSAWIERGLGDGTLLRVEYETGHLAAYRADGSPAGRAYPGPLVTASARHVVHGDPDFPCRRCTTMVRDIRTGRDSVIPGMPQDVQEAGISPDGSRLAVVSGDTLGTQYVHVCGIAPVTRCRRLAGSEYEIAESRFYQLAWRGDRLYAMASRRGDTARLAMWQDGWTDLRRLPRRVDAVRILA